MQAIVRLTYFTIEFNGFDANHMRNNVFAYVFICVLKVNAINIWNVQNNRKYEKCFMLKTLLWNKLHERKQNRTKPTHFAKRRLKPKTSKSTNGRPYEKPIPRCFQSLVSLCIVGSSLWMVMRIEVYRCKIVFTKYYHYVLGMCVCVLLLSLSTVSEPEWKNIWFKSYYRGKCDSHVTS